MISFGPDPIGDTASGDAIDLLKGAPTPPTFGDGVYVRSMNHLRRLFESPPPHPGNALSTLSGIPIIASKLVPGNKMFVVVSGNIVGVYEFTEEGKV